MTEKEEHHEHFTLIAIVAIVAIVALVVMVITTANIKTKEIIPVPYFEETGKIGQSIITPSREVDTEAISSRDKYQVKSK